MKKLLFIAVLLCLAKYTAFAQAYYDAMTLRRQYETSTDAIRYTDTTVSILKKYFNKDVLKQSDIDANPFLRGMISIATAADTNIAQTTGGSFDFSQIGGLDVSTVADGIAKFLIKRGKQELSIAFFQRFKKVINDDPDLKTLFPTTVPLLDAIDEEVYNYSAYLQNLREAFKSDIAALPKNLPGIVINHHAFFVKQPQLVAALYTASYLAVQLQNHAHPGDIIANLPDSILTRLDAVTADSTGQKHYLKGSIQTVQLLNDAFRNNSAAEDASYWVSASQIKTLLADRISFRIFMGLIYQNAKLYYNGIVFNDDKYTLTGILDTAAATIIKAGPVAQSYKVYLSEFSGQLDVMNKLIRDYQKLPSDSVSVDKYTSYAKAAVGLLEKASDVGNLNCVVRSGRTITTVTIYSYLHLPDLHTVLKPYFNISYSFADLVADIGTKNYSAAVNQAALVYNQAVKLAPANSSGPSSETLAAFMKYGSFMAAVATAKTSDDVETAIEAAALPVGSYTVKQKSVWNVSLNGYVGYGQDRHYADGVYAPVGFSVNKGLGKSGGVITAFASIIDVGSLVSYHLNNADSIKSANLKQTIRLESIISPSLQLMYELPNFPLTVGFGKRRTPRLFYSKDDSFSVVEPRWVWNFCVLIDIPIFTLHNRPRSLVAQ